MNDRIFNDSLSDSEYLDALREQKDIERVKTGLVMFSKLKEFISYQEPEIINSIDDFPKLFNRHKIEYEKQYPLTTESQFRKRYISKAERLLTGIKVLLPTHIDTTEFIICERYMNEYLSQKPEDSTITQRKMLCIKAYLMLKTKGTYAVTETIKDVLQANGHDSKGKMVDNVRQAYYAFEKRISGINDKSKNTTISQDDIKVLQELLPTLKGKEHELAFIILQKATNLPS